MTRILVVEDDIQLNKVTCDFLSVNDYKVDGVSNGEEALDMVLENEYSLIISDIMMPVMDGFTFLERLRKVGNNTPVVFMSARDDKFSKQLGYKLGVDDYIIKPFDLDELVLKIGAILRRTKIAENKSLQVGNLTLDQEEHMAYIDGQELSLTVREFDLLFKLLSFPKKTFTRSQLMEEFWDYDSSATSRTVDVYMAKLRDKTSGCDGFEIITVHGLGYKAVIK